MKKIIACALLLATVLSVCACGNGSETATTASTPADTGTETTTQDRTQATSFQMEELPTGVFYAGYSRQDITPEAPVPLGGYGNTDRRISTDVLDTLYCTSVALTDEEGDTILLMTMDTTRAYENVIEGAKLLISETTGLPVEQIMIAASHTHSGPDYSNTSNANIPAAITKCQVALLKAAQESLMDRKPSTIFTGDIEAESLNFVKHYQHTLADGTVKYFGDNFGTGVYDETTVHTTQSDPTMHVVKFEREDGKPIVLTNWRAHPIMTGGGTKGDMSADYPGAFREAFEAQYDAHFIFFQGAAGNINPYSRIDEENVTGKDYKVQGAMLADYAIQCLNNNMTQTGTESYDIKIEQILYEGKINHTTDSLYAQALEISSVWNSTSDASLVKELGAPYGIRSGYHAGAIVSRAKMGESKTLELYAISVGEDLAIVTAPNELFDTNSAWLEENSPYAMTLTFGYCNGHVYYIPSAICWEYTSYETDTTRFIPGTAEEIQDTFLAKLIEFKNA